MRQFEIPYNFDENLILQLQENPYLKNIYCIYLPCFWKDGENSRYNLMLENKLPKTWKEYKQHIFNIMKIAKPSVLF